MIIAGLSVGVISGMVSFILFGLWNKAMVEGNNSPLFHPEDSYQTARLILLCAPFPPLLFYGVLLVKYLRRLEGYYAIHGISSKWQPYFIGSALVGSLVFLILYFVVLRINRHNILFE